MMTEPLWHDEPGESGVTYRIHRDGRVVAYGRERGSRHLWIASSWSKHPLKHDDAVHIMHIAADSTWDELQEALREWAEESHTRTVVSTCACGPPGAVAVQWQLRGFDMVSSCVRCGGDRT